MNPGAGRSAHQLADKVPELVGGFRVVDGNQAQQFAVKVAALLQITADH